MGSPFFRNLSESEIHSLASIFTVKPMAEGAIVFLENMKGESLFLVRQGAVKISRMLAEGDERILVVLGPEEFFGEMALLDAGPRSVSARVAEEANLLCLHKDDFEEFCERNPATGIKILRNLIETFSQRLRENREEYREMLRWSLEKKI